MTKSFYLFFLSIFLVLLQSLILNNINLFGYVNPYLYIAFIFLYPIKKDRTSLLTFSFIIGLAIDLFTDSGGVHTIATLSIAFIRLNLFNRLFQKPESDYELFNFKKEPFSDVFNYITTLTIVHHFILFCVVNFSSNNFIKHVILNTALSSIFTLTLYFLGSFIFRKRARNEA